MQRFATERAAAPDHRPDNVVIVGDGLQIALYVPSFSLTCFFSPPAQGSVVVVGTGVNDGVGYELMRQIQVAFTVGESELKDSHAGHSEMFA